MLGLTEQIDRDHERSGGCIVGDHQNFGRTGQQVDAHGAEELALGLGHVGVPGPTMRSTRPMPSMPKASEASA